LITPEPAIAEVSGVGPTGDLGRAWRIHVGRPRPRRLLAFGGAGSLGGFVVIHAVHVAAVGAAPVAIQFICHIAH
jgi:hypothetical protein